jgi:abortive infection bacteriophage resistance protein
MLDNKSPKTVQDQVQLLLSRGMSVDRISEAERFLNNVSYYRLKGYWWDDQSDTVAHRFKPGTDFWQIVDRYNFDRELRLIALNMIERIEVGLRTRMAYTLSHHHGPHWFTEVKYFKNRKVWSGHLVTIRNEVDQSKEIFIKEHHRKYGATDPRPPAAWKTFEILSLGVLSKLFKSIDDGTTGKQEIVNYFGLPRIDVLESWLETITVLRNLCAHHGRLYGRPLPLQMRFLRSPTHPWVNQGHLSGDDAKSVYAVICAGKYLLHTISPNNRFTQRLKKLLQDHPSVDPTKIGFPANWRSQPLWQ